MIPPTALQWLRSPALTPLWTAIRGRLQRNGRQATGRLTVRCPEHEQREAVGQLLGRAVGSEAGIDLAALDRLLRSSAAGAGLVDVVEAITGPIPDRRAAAAAEQDRRASLREQALAAASTAGLDGQVWLTEWLDRAFRGGIAGRLPSQETHRLLTRAITTLGLILAGTGGLWSRGELAEQVTGTAHGLDDDTLLNRLVLRGIALATTGQAEAPASAVDRRALWESVGVAGDTVATTALTYGLVPLGDGWQATQLRERASHHREAHLTLRDLRQLLPIRLAPQTVYVCENPRVLEAAAQARVRAAMVCTLGNPTAVTLALIDAVAANDGVRLRYHGDFDWPGVAIAGRLMRRTGAGPWRFTAADYEAAVLATRDPDTPPHQLSGAPVATAWDPDLATAMLREGVAVHEERVTEALLADLMRNG
ncbi:TIGR02679 family protein [Dactylosporangium sp. NBC_01737]|uniref:TIGR02679 family protein n=1 Tax=Dactylosporangium sp. NBC_01737 TaxID=2975959 RepID=UPI002E157D5D|nr:TIGR02679 family protein [Dactylosporangium sp. NBC_01737]